MRQIGHDLTGKRFGRLVVLREVDLENPEANGNSRGWLCQCDCGKQIVSTQKKLELNGTKSCGCLLSDVAREKIETKNTVGHYSGTTVSAIRPERPPNKNNTSGFKGIHWSTREEIWVVQIGFKGKNIKIGRFKNLDDAIKARKEAEKKYFIPIIEEYDSKDKGLPEID